MFWEILLAHLLTDFVLQPNWMNRRKNQVAVLFLHGGIFWGLSLLFLASSLTWPIAGGLAALAGLHGLIDFTKTRFQHKLEARGAALFLVDQGLHLAGIVAFLLVFDPGGSSALGCQIGSVLPEANGYFLLSFPIIIILGGGYFTAAVCRGFLLQLQATERPGIAQAGRYVGILERSLILASVMVGRFEIIGFLLAAKSIVRHPEMKGDTAFAEYFLVGTLTSMSWAFFGSLLFQRLVG